MKKEKLKTIILTLLIFSSVILSVQIWFVNPAWPNAYSLSSVFSLFAPKQNNNPSLSAGAFNSVFSPRSYVLTYNDGRISISTTEPKAESIRNAFNSVLQSALSTGSFNVIAEEEWQTMLQSNGISADFSVPVSISAIAEFLSVDTPQVLPVATFNQAVMTINPFLGNTYLTLRNASDNQHIRITVSENAAEPVYRIYEEYSTQTKESIAYAFEMNLDKVVTQGAVQQKVLFDSYVLIPLESVSMQTIMPSRVDFTEATTEEILRLFGHNPKIARKFVEANGAIVYVENKSTLKLDPSTGAISYTASPGNGLALPGNGSLSAVASGCGRLIDNIFNLFPIDSNLTLFINSPLVADNPDTYTIAFDYLYNGNSIYSQNHNCVIEIQNGKIISFNAKLKNYTPVSTPRTENTQAVLDTLYTSQNKDALIVNSLYTGYIDGNTAMPLYWRAEIQGTNEIITVK